MAAGALGIEAGQRRLRAAADETVRASRPHRSEPASVEDRVSLSGDTPDLVGATVGRIEGAAQMRAGIAVVRTIDESLQDLLEKLR